MKLDDYLVALTVALLTCDASRLDPVKAGLEQGPYDFTTPGAPRKVSVGGVAGNGERRGLFAWVDALRGSASPAVRVIHSSAIERPGREGVPGLPAHIAAGFAGAEVHVLQVVAGKETTLYRLRTIFSAHSLMRPPDFVQWAASQPAPGAVGDRILRLVNEANALNDRPSVSPGSLRAFLLSEAGEGFFEFNQDSLILAVQQVLAAAGESPVIAPDHAKYFVKNSPELRLTDNPDPFTLYLFEPMAGTPPAMQRAPAASRRDDYRAALREIETFARSVETPFFEAFRLAGWVLGTDACTFSTLKPEEHEELAAALATDGFSETARRILKDEVRLINDFARIGWAEARLRALLSCSIADVFGGMGSWNDLTFDGEQQGIYEAATQKLYGALRGFFLSDVLNA